MMINNKVELFKDNFPDFNMEMEYCTFQDNSNEIESILVIFISKFTTDQLESNWNFINSWIAANVQLDFHTEFEIWNLYLVFIVNETVKKRLKSKIENDTFSSRKLVIDDGMPNKEIIKHYITKEDFISMLSNSTKNVTTSENLENQIKQEVFKPDSYLQNLIKKHNLAGRKDNETREALINLIQKWSNA